MIAGSVREWASRLLHTDNDLLETKTDIDQWKQLKRWLGYSIQNDKETHTFTKQPSQKIQESSKQVTWPICTRDLITTKLSKLPVFACVQHSTSPVLNAINMFDLCNMRYWFRLSVLLLSTYLIIIFKSCYASSDT